MRLTEKIAVSSVIVVLSKFLFAGISFKLGSIDFTLGTVDATTIAAILTPCLGCSHLENYVKNKVQATTKEEGQ